MSLGLGLDVGIPLDRRGKWQLLLGAQGRIISGMGGDLRNAYLLGLKFGFLKGPALGESGLQLGAFGEVGSGSFSSIGSSETGLERGGYTMGGVSLGYTPGLQASGIPFLALELGAGVRLDFGKPEVQDAFFAGVLKGGFSF